MKKVIIIVSTILALLTGCLIGYSLIDGKISKKQNEYLIEE